VIVIVGIVVQVQILVQIGKNMNEQRITDHAEHCDFYVGNEHYDKSHEEQQRLWTLKFAELIIEECMRMCDVAAVGYESHNHIKEANGCNSAKEYIAEHFGVRE
jgi:hypothetical protein